VLRYGFKDERKNWEEIDVEKHNPVWMKLKGKIRGKNISERIHMNIYILKLMLWDDIIDESKRKDEMKWGLYEYPMDRNNNGMSLQVKCGKVELLLFNNDEFEMKHNLH